MAHRPLKTGVGGDVAQSSVVARRPNSRQPALRLHPMPDRVEPCLALRSSKPPAGPDWAYEVKWDLYRLAPHVERGKVRIMTRGGHD